MRNLLSRVSAAFVLGSLAVLSPLAGLGLAHAQGTDIPLENFAIRSTMSNVALSPSGKHLAMMRILTKDGNPYIEIYETSNLGGDPVRIGSDRSEIIRYRWVNDDRLLVDFRNRYKRRVEDVNDGVYAYTSAIVKRTGGKFIELPRFVSVLHTMPTSENEVMAYGRPDARIRSDGTLTGGALGAPDLFTIDVRNGRRARTIVRGLNYGGWRFDSEDRLRGGQDYDPVARELVLYTRDPAAEEWREFHRLSASTRENFVIEGFDPENENMAFVVANNGEDTLGLYEFDLRTGKYGDLLFRHPEYDVIGAVFSSNPNRVREIVGVEYLGDDGWPEVAYLTTEAADEERQFRAPLEAAFPGKVVEYPSRTEDLSQAIIYTHGPQDPGTYYLYKAGQGLQPLGSRNPLLKPEDLASMQYIKYKARDGRTIPGYLHIPPTGEAPYPLVVLPHGGPWVQEIVIYDEWAQVLASRGYAVLQPQFRGSLGYGLDHWTSSFGEWGGAMQDDMEDGAKALVRQGLVDEDRLAMFGWSYGGYAALVASLREPQIFQCSVSGAPVSDPVRFSANFEGGGLSRIQFAQLQEGYGGVIPEDRTADVNVPIMVIHGDDDQRVLVRHSEAFVAGLKANRKPHEFIVLEGADHFSNTLFFDHKLKLYSSLTSFLAEDCGPGGL